jgi:HEAT repeat protein
VITTRLFFAFILSSLPLLRLGCAWGAAAETPRTICTATLSSDNEKKIFEKHLKGKGFRFVELTDYQSADKSANAGDGSEWFEKACDAKVQCDVLVISGHFSADGFFAENYALTLPTSHLEQRSCAKSCEGILKNPKEVYLLGCNTLASKAADSRTPEEYRQVLVHDGIDSVTAAQIVASRYSPLGESSREIMQKAFQGVPAIYGFESFGPKGDRIAPFLDKYVNKISDYRRRLDELEAQKVIHAIDQGNKVLKSNYADWAQAMGSANFSYASCSGSQQKFDNQCALFNDKLSRYQKLLTIEKMVNSPERLKYMLSIKTFLADADMTSPSPAESAALQRIRNNEPAKKEYLTTLNKLEKSPSLSLPFFDLGTQLGWVQSKDLIDYLTENLNHGLKEDDDNVICQSRLNHDSLDLKMKSLRPSAIKNPRALNALGCLGVSDTDLLLTMTNVINSPDETLSEAATNALLKISPQNTQVSEKLSEFLESQNPEVRLRSITLIGMFKASPPLVTQRLAKALASPDEKIRERAKFILRAWKPKDPETLKMIKEADPSVLSW